MATGKRDLVGLAYHVAEQLVGTALEQLLGETAHAAGGSVSVEVHLAPPADPRALPPAPATRRGRTPGPKPGRTKRQDNKRATRTDAGDRVLAQLKKKSPLKPADLARAAGLSSYRMNRLVEGLAKQGVVTVTGQTSGRRVHLGCAGKRPPLAAEPQEACCGRCDHDQSNHEMSKGKCLVPRCVCQEFYA